MKKLILLLTLISVMLLGACSSSDSTLDTRVYDLENDVITLQNELAIMQERFDNLVYTEGLNGQRDYYENESYSSLSALAYETMTKEGDVIDWGLFPDYVRNIDTGEYVSVDDLAKLLVAKYFNGTEATGSIGFQYKITFELTNSNMTNEEYIARLSLLIIELSNYDFYTIDTSQLYFYNYFNGQTIEVKSRMSLLVTDKYVLIPVIFYGELLDVSITGISYDSLLVQSYCDDYVTNLTYDGYVLDYK